MVVVIGLGACASGTDQQAPLGMTLGGTGENTTATGAASGSTTTTGDPPSTSTTDAGDTTAAEPTDGGEESSTGPVLPPDLNAGSWMFENVSNSGPISLHPVYARLPEGNEVFAWAETRAGRLSVLNIHGAVRTDPRWSASVLTDADFQHTFPAMAVGDEGYLVWSGRNAEGDDRDVFLSVVSPQGWSSVRNLTNAFDVPTTVNEGGPAIGVRDGDQLFIAYTSAEPPPPKAPAPTPTVYVLETTPGGQAGDQIELISPVQADCDDVVAAAAEDGTGHVIARCRDGDQTVFIHGSDRSGEWDTDTLAGTTTGLLSPAMAPGEDGNVHLTWIQDRRCGADLCDDVYYASTANNVFSGPIQVTGTANFQERTPSVGVDRWGRVLVFSQARVDGQAGLYLSISEDGETFGEPTLISPPTLDDYQGPSRVLFSDEGYPSVAYERVVDSSDPLNIDVGVARFVPN